MMARVCSLAWLSLLIASSGKADNLYRPGNWPSLASDRKATMPGDVLTILVFENSTASNSATSGSKKAARLSGRAVAGSSLDTSASAELSGGSESQGSNGRSGKMVAQISVTVETVMPNGDLQVSGNEHLNLGGERTVIKLRGRVRSADITAANTILSSRIADAQIDYDGKGFVSRSGKPGFVTRIFNWLGLL
jgi:flagellar L-ring protein precursor FlgH